MRIEWFICWLSGLFKASKLYYMFVVTPIMIYNHCSLLISQIKWLSYRSFLLNTDTEIEDFLQGNCSINISMFFYLTFVGKYRWCYILYNMKLLMLYKLKHFQDIGWLVRIVLGLWLWQMTSIHLLFYIYRNWICLKSASADGIIF